MSAAALLLAEIPMFAPLDDEERRSLAELLVPRSFRQGETLFSFGDSGDTLHIVRLGRVEVFVENTEGDRIVVGENGPGDCFGEISMLDGGGRTATAVALEETETLTLSRGHLLDLFAQHPHSALDLLGVLGARLRATDELLRNQVTRNPNVEEEEMLTFGQHVADRVAAFGGSWSFILIFMAIIAVWMTVNVLLAFKSFDPYPFILLNLMLSSLAALQAPVIMMSQNRQAFKDRLNADADYKVNLKAELEVAHLHRKVDRIYEEMQAAFARMAPPRNSSPGGPTGS
jgi:CRP/FNR family transcriptional regulator, cyclic AMP receptor protein